MFFKTKEEKLRATTLKHFRDLTLARFIAHREVKDLKMTSSKEAGSEQIEVVVAESNKSKLANLPDHFEGFPIVVIGR